MIRILGVFGLLAACADPGGTDDDTGTPGVCVPGADEPRVLEFGSDLTAGPAEDGDVVPVGIPPQGGAPYAPFDVRVRADLQLGERITVSGEMTEDGAVIATASQEQSMFCSNTGVHEGYQFGPELHLRFSGLDVETLTGREVVTTVWAVLPDDAEVEMTATGVLAWRLGPGAPEDG